MFKDNVQTTERVLQNSDCRRARGCMLSFARSARSYKRHKMFPIRTQNQVRSRTCNNTKRKITKNFNSEKKKRMLPAISNQNTAHHQVHLDNSSNNSGAATTPKRNSSMIFRIEHLLPLAPDTSSSANIETISPDDMDNIQDSNSTTNANGAYMRHSKIGRTSGVFLKQFAPKDTISDSINTLTLMSISSNSNTEQPSSQRSQNGARTYCSIMQGMLRITPHVMRRIKLSEDIHSYNSLFEVHNGDVRLRIVRDIARDEELIAWFDEEITILMSIPFLTPLNIQGNNRYTCHICQLTFETPNPLKIHLALSCERHTLDILWIRLYYALKSTALHQRHLPMPLVHHHLPTISPALRSSTQITCASTTLTTVPSFSSPRVQRFSAFKPISPSNAPIVSLAISTSSGALPTSTYTTSNVNIPPLISHSSNTISFLPTLSSSTGLGSMNLLQPANNSPLNAAAQIEAIVSNMGASKQGHLCIYCGKVYSRKYGLKIHIRTHTGFKPLKCKFCFRPFGDPSNLNKHVRLHLQSGSTGSHTNETIDGYKCHLCHKTLARRRDLQRHIESRHNSGS